MYLSSDFSLIILLISQNSAENKIKVADRPSRKKCMLCCSNADKHSSGMFSPGGISSRASSQPGQYQTTMTRSHQSHCAHVLICSHSRLFLKLCSGKNNNSCLTFNVGLYDITVMCERASQIIK